jgi:hypothetical protein
MKDPVKDRIVRYGLLETIDQRHFYATIETAVEAFRDEVKIHRTDLLGSDHLATVPEQTPVDKNAPAGSA